MLTKISKIIALIIFSVVLTGCANSDFHIGVPCPAEEVQPPPNNFLFAVDLMPGQKYGQFLKRIRLTLTVTNKKGPNFFQKGLKGKSQKKQIRSKH